MRKDKENRLGGLHATTAICMSETPKYDSVQNTQAPYRPNRSGMCFIMHG